MKKILITGRSGFIGNNIIENFGECYNIQAPTSVELNLLCEQDVYRFLSNDYYDVVIHMANRNNTRKKITKYDSLDGNLRIFFNLERCNQMYGKMIYFGSGAEYDSRAYLPLMNENYFDQNVPVDSYGFSKYIMAKTCEMSDNIYELCLFGVYGKYEEWERRFISNAICRALKGMDITLQKHMMFDYLYVDDLAKIVKWFIENDPKEKRYNVCRGESIDLYDLALIVKKILGVENRIVVGGEGWKPEYSGDNSRLIQEMGGFEFTGFEESIQSLCEYYKGIIDTIDERKL